MLTSAERETKLLKRSVFVIWVKQWGAFLATCEKRERRKEKKERRERKEKEREKSVGGIKITWACSCCCCCFSWLQIPLSLSLSHDFLLLLLLHLRYRLSQPTTTTTTTIFLIPLPCRAGHGWRQGILRRFPIKILFLILNNRLICSSGKKKCGIFSFVFSPTKRRGRVFFLLFSRLFSIAELGGRFRRERETFCFFFFFWVFGLVWSEIGARVFDVWIFVLLLLISEKAPISL